MLLTSPSKEVRVLTRMMSADPRSISYRNVSYLRAVTGMANVECYSSWTVWNFLSVQKVPEKKRCQVGLMITLLGMQSEKYLMVQDYIG